MLHKDIDMEHQGEIIFLSENVSGRTEKMHNDWLTLYQKKHKASHSSKGGSRCISSFS